MHRPWLGLVPGLLVACGTTSADPEQRAAAEGRLLAPLLDAVEVHCAELVVEATANFHSHVARPAVDAAAHTMSRSRTGACTEWVWTNRSGDPRLGFVVRVGAVGDPAEISPTPPPGTVFRVANRFTLRLHEDHRPLQLEVTAGGNGRAVDVVRAGRPALQVPRFAVRDGALELR